MVSRVTLAAVPPYPAGALGPRNTPPPSADDILKLVKRAAERFQTDERKKRAYKRWQIYNEDYTSLIVERIGELQNDDETIREMTKNASVALNVALDITKAVAVCYKQRPRRSIEGANDSAASAFHRLMLESRIDILAPEWNQLAFLAGPVCVTPMVRKGRIRWDVLLPHFYDVLRDPEDPMGMPLAVAWTISEQEDVAKRVDTCCLDSESWRYYKTEGGRPRLVDQVDHGLGVFPGSVFRLDTPYDGDWWGGARNERLVHGSIDVGVINCALNFVRKTQNKKLLTVIGDLRGVPKQQKLDPESTVNANTLVPGSIAINALDFDTDPDKFIRHIRFIYETLIEAFGIPAQAVNFDATSGSEGERLRMTQEGLTELRNAQLPFAQEFEHDLAVKTVMMARRFGHPLAADLPEPEAVERGFRIEFPKLAKAFNDPNAEVAYSHYLLQRGLVSELELLRRDNPHLDDAQVLELQEKFLDERSRFHDAVTSRNLGLDDEGKVISASQANGALGTPAREANAASEDAAEGESNGQRE